MTLLQAILLGIIQGATEFFPVSSSAHIYIARSIMNMANDSRFLHFDLICHTGTTIALIIYLYKDLYHAIRDKQQCFLLCVAILPLIPFYFLIKSIHIFQFTPSYLGYALLFTSLILFIASKKKEIKRNGMSTLKVKDVLCIGLIQTLALMPGISRSGSTISMARFLGWNWISAARFSFLLAIPTILGGLIVEALQSTEQKISIEEIHVACYIAGFCTSLFVGFFSVQFVFQIYEKGKVAFFSWYCLGAGLFALRFFYGS